MAPLLDRPKCSGVFLVFYFSLLIFIFRIINVKKQQEMKVVIALQNRNFSFSLNFV